MPKLHTVTTRSRILIAGAGVAGLEAMMALRALLGGTVEIELLSPEAEFSYRPLAVAEPFGIGEVRRYDLARIAAEHDAHWRMGSLGSVDPSVATAWTEDGTPLRYDYLVVAVGAHASSSIDGALSFTGILEREALTSILADAQSGRIRRLVFAVPPAVAWVLPLYELALFTSAWARQHGVRDLALSLVSPESRPLEAFGRTVSSAVESLLEDAGVALMTGRRVTRFDGERVAIAGHAGIDAQAVIALPRLDGPYLPGVPHDGSGFLPTDRHGAVRGVQGVYGAGDGTSFPIKQGGLAAQQADAVAASIAADLGAIECPEPFVPVLRGLLLTGGAPRYLRATSQAGAPGKSEIAFTPLWWPPAKIAGRHLAAYFGVSGGVALTRSPLVDRASPGSPESPVEAAVDERDAVDLLLELADANARRGSHRFALKCLEAAEDVGGPLPAKRQAQRRKWETASHPIHPSH